MLILVDKWGKGGPTNDLSTEKNALKRQKQTHIFNYHKVLAILTNMQFFCYFCCHSGKGA